VQGHYTALKPRWGADLAEGASERPEIRYCHPYQRGVTSPIIERKTAFLNGKSRRSSFILKKDGVNARKEKVKKKRDP